MFIYLMIFIRLSGAQTVVIGDPSFENIPVNANSYVYVPISSDWSFSLTTGVVDPFCDFTSSEAPDGEQFAFVQNNYSITQNLFFPESGIYEISYYVAGRKYAFPWALGDLTYKISLNNTEIYLGNTVTNQEFGLVSSMFYTDSGSYLFKIEGANPDVYDDTAYFDDIMIVFIPDLVFENGFE